MADARIKAVVLDLFDTIVEWNPAGLPRFEWRGREVRSTAPLLFKPLEAALGEGFDRDAFLEMHESVIREIFAERAGDNPREVTCYQRFERILLRLGIDDARARSLADELRRTHMGQVRAVTSAPPHRVEAVHRLKRAYRLGLLSNFDDSETGHQIMQDTGVRDLFDAVVLSADLGLRKPSAGIFAAIAGMLALDPQEILFVGDTANEDVLGSKRAGMRAAWINRHGKPLPDGIPQPDIIIADLAELPGALGL
ncbi:MAG TPA: HAD family hydrolase [Candidatus Binataceae bacterium]|nr:HAD family hydrolase [Candidatus Binataceae bacterium]